MNEKAYKAMNFAGDVYKRQIKGVSIAHGKTNEFLKEQQKQAQDSHYIDV